MSDMLREQEQVTDSGQIPEDDWAMQASDGELYRAAKHNSAMLKARLNACANAFAQARDAYRSSYGPEIAATRVWEDRNLWRAFRLAKALLGDGSSEGRNDGWIHYFGHHISPRDFKIEELLDMLIKYDPAKKQFANYLDYVLVKRSQRVSSKESATAAIPECIKTDKTERLDVLSTWGDFAEFIAEQTRLRKSVEGYKTTRYTAYLTRDYLLQVCKNYQADAIDYVRHQVDGALEQPYIQYMRSEYIDDEAAARRYIQTKRPKSVGALRLLALYNRPARDPKTHEGDGLIEERYKTQKAFNAYFGKANLNEDYSHYEEGRKTFFRKELFG